MPIPNSTLDAVLSLQLTVAWAGEADTDPARLGWWRTAMVDEYGGADLMKRLAPQTWRWAALQAVREAARRADAAGRAKSANPDAIVSLFRFGSEIDERLDERLIELKHLDANPRRALPRLAETTDTWDRDLFAEYLAAQTPAEHAADPVGRRLKGAPPGALDLTATKLAAALLPLHTDYPLPHYRR